MTQVCSDVGNALVWATADNGRRIKAFRAPKSLGGPRNCDAACNRGKGNGMQLQYTLDAGGAAAGLYVAGTKVLAVASSGALFSWDIAELEPQQHWKLPTLPTTLRQLEWSGIRLEHMPQLAHTGLTELVCTTCNQLQQLPELPASLETLKVMGLKQVTKLPKLPPSIKKIDVGITPIVELPGPLPHLEALHLWNTPIQRLPALAGCKQLNLADCEHLQQLRWLLICST